MAMDSAQVARMLVDMHVPRETLVRFAHGMTPAKLARIRHLQTPDPEKRRRADFVIETGTTRIETAAQIRKLIACLRAHGVRYSGACGKSSSTRKPPA